MGYFTATSQTAFAQSAAEVYDFVSNPDNWSSTYKGSGGIPHALDLPLKVGDTWSEVVELDENTYRSDWTLITAVPERLWEFRQIDKIGQSAEGVGGVDGITTITYEFGEVGEGVTLFTRTIRCVTPQGVGIPDDLLTVRARPDGIDRYHAAIKARLGAR